MSTISGTVTTTVVLGSADYPSPLTVTSSGTIAVGGSSPRDFGVYSNTAGVSLTNQGHIYAYTGVFAQGGQAGVDLAAGGTVINSGAIVGNYGGYKGYTAGAGVSLNGGTLSNSGGILGGSGGYGNEGGGSGGTGVDLTAAGMVTNNGNISGGGGGPGGIHFSGAGGAGVVLAANSTLTNTANINGGNGANYAGNSSGGSGGVGVNVSTGDVLTNTGHITGGAGGGGGVYVGAYAGGNGGAGVFLNGGSLATSGTISGGQGGPGNGGPAGANGDAVQFGTLASTLSVNPGAVFNGQVAANASVDDVLRLRGTEGAGTAITLGAQFTGFSTLQFGAGAAWTVDASSGAASSGAGLGLVAFTTSDTIDVTNRTPTQVAAEFNAATHVLADASDGTLNFAGPFSGEYFVFSSDGSSGTDITLATGPIATTLLYTVTLGNASFTSPLTITNTGVVSPSIAGATGVVSSNSTNSLTNNGTIQGGVGADLPGAGGTGGIGVKLVAGTLTNTDSITGGAGGNGGTTGGHGGAGVFLNGGTLTTSGMISGGAGGMGTPTGAAGDAVQFGSAASTLMVDPGAVFTGEVVANSSVHDVLELSGTQSAGSAITLGTQFIGFSTLDFAAGAAWTVDATKAALMPPHTTLTIDGFGLGDTLDITNLAASHTTEIYNPGTDTLTITKGTTAINVNFDSPFTGDHFVLTANGSGTDVSLAADAGPTFAASAHDLTNFVSEEHRASMGGRFMLSTHSAGSGFSLQADPVLLAFGGHGFSSNAFIERGVGHEQSLAFR